MAKKIANAEGKGAAKVRSDREKAIQALIALVVLLGVIALIWFFLVTIEQLLFSRNPRLVLREIEVSDGVYWHDHIPKLSALLGIRAGDHLFALDPQHLRERLCGIPSVESAEINRILPDTLELRVVERIPRAELIPGGLWVMDQSGVVIAKRESMAAGQNLPRLMGVPVKGLAPGQRIVEIAPAMELITLVAREFPDIHLRAIDVKELGLGLPPEQRTPPQQQKLTLWLRFRNQEIDRKVVIPAYGNMNLLLTALQSAIIQSRETPRSGQTFNISYEGIVVIK